MQKASIFMALGLCMILFASCKKKDSGSVDNTVTHEQILSYLPVYPASYWKYVTGIMFFPKQWGLPGIFCLEMQGPIPIPRSPGSCKRPSMHMEIPSSFKGILSIMPIPRYIIQPIPGRSIKRTWVLCWNAKLILQTMIRFIKRS